MGCIGSRVAFFRGCTLSRSSSSTSRQNSRRQNTFAVQNVDDTGQGISPGKLEVTETDLVLHVKGKASLTWPLRCLRRYGYDNDLFSFESGRRCPTGAGIFAFRCHRAQSLFNLLQAKIQGNPTPLPTVPSTPLTPGNPNSTAASTPASSTFVYVNLSENSSRLLQASSTAQKISISAGGSSGEPPDLVQNPVPGTSSSSEPKALRDSRGPVSGKPSSSSENHPVYMNVESHGGALFAASSSSTTKISSNIPPPTAPRKNLTSKSTSNELAKPKADCALYSNVFCNHNRGTSAASISYGGAVSSSCTPGPTTSTSSSSSTTTTTTTTVLPRAPPPIDDSAEINYAELDLKTDSASNSPSSTRLRFPAAGADPFKNLQGKRDFGHPRLSNQQQNNGDPGYATIDFDKTAQLSVITRSKITLGFETEKESTKKSRHGSTGL